MDPSGGSRGRDADAVIRELGRRQHEVVSTAQLLAAGVSYAIIRERVARGWLHPVHRGVYAVGRRDLELRGRLMAAALSVGEGAAVSHASAGALWEICRAPRGPAHISSLTHRRGSAGVRVHRCRRLRPADRGQFGSIPATSLERTLLDMAMTERERAVRRAFHEADRLGHLAMPKLRAAWSETGPRKGSGVIGRLIDEAREPVYSQSDLEELILDMCRDAGIPEPEMNATVCGREVDAWWAGARVSLEGDGWDTHRGRASFEDDRARDAMMLAAGIRVMRVTWRRLERDPAGVAADLAAILRRRSW